MITDLDIATARWTRAINRMNLCKRILQNKSQKNAEEKLNVAVHEFSQACKHRAKIRNKSITTVTEFTVDWNG